MPEDSAFYLHCRLCPRLSDFLSAVKAEHPDYHALPVAPFGDAAAQLLVVGLAPGMHGANRTGRPFTGDYAGVLLYQTLFDLGFSNQALGDDPEDGLQLKNCRISNAVKCLPPENKPTPAEIRTCNRYLKAELHGPQAPKVIVALGKIAHDAVLLSLGLKARDYPFGHGTEYALPEGGWLVSSYHCSRYNTQTKRLTPEMFQSVFKKARTHLDS